MESSIADISIPDVASQRHRKRLRKGTHSCTECRRRKIRCIFASRSSVCVRCIAQGSNCVEQGEAVDVNGQVKHGTLPRPVISSASQGRLRPQASPDIFDLQDSRPVNHISCLDKDEDGYSSDIETSSRRRPPLVSVLEQAEDGNSMVSSHSKSPSRNPVVVKAAIGKSRICEALREALPSYDEIIATLARNGAWWDSFRQKTRAISQAEPAEPLLSFGAHAYTSTSPAELGILAVAYARSLGRNHRLFALVDSLIIADSTLTATLEGMECLILLAKSYTDVGQPRRSWLTWRRGLAAALLMGLHRIRSDTSAIRQRIWLAVYHGDRFTSLLLGLPHGFNDAHLDMSTTPGAMSHGPLEIWLPQFIHRCAVVAGEVIDYIVSPGNVSFARAMALDEQMDAIYASAPVGWWDIHTTLPDNLAQLNHLVEQLLVQFFFFHVRMYIHLPLLKSSSHSPSFSSSSSYTVSKIACTNAARHMLKRYLVLRADRNGGSLFDCKTSDFVGFTAAVVLLIGNSWSNENPRMPGFEDLQMVADSEAVFYRLEKETTCNVAAQCRRALISLSHPIRDGKPGQDIPVPYFGNITRTQAWGNSPIQDDVDNTNVTAGLSPLDLQSSWQKGNNMAYMNYHIQDIPTDVVWAGGGNIDDNPMLSYGPDAAYLDIDQDWSQFITYT